MKKILVLVVLFAVTVSLNAQSLNGKTFVIQSVANGKVIDADGNNLGKNGTKIQLWKKSTISHQNWKFVFANKGKSVYYIMYTNSKAGIYKYLDASAIDLGKNGGALQLWQDNGYARGSGAEANQLWIVTKNADGAYRIASAHPKANGASLDTNETQNKNGGIIQLWQRLNHKNQAWKLIPIGEKKLIPIGPPPPKELHPGGGF